MAVGERLDVAAGERSDFGDGESLGLGDGERLDLGDGERLDLAAAAAECVTTLFKEVVVERVRRCARLDSTGGSSRGFVGAFRLDNATRDGTRRADEGSETSDDVGVVGDCSGGSRAEWTGEVRRAAPLVHVGGPIRSKSTAYTNSCSFPTNSPLFQRLSSVSRNLVVLASLDASEAIASTSPTFGFATNCAHRSLRQMLIMSAYTSPGTSGRTCRKIAGTSCRLPCPTPSSSVPFSSLA